MMKKCFTFLYCPYYETQTAVLQLSVATHNSTKVNQILNQTAANLCAASYITYLLVGQFW